MASGGLGRSDERPVTTPNGPHETSELVRDRDRNFVVHAGGRKVVHPLSQPIWLLTTGMDEDGPRAVDQEGAQVAVSALGNAAEVAPQAA